MYFFLSPLKIYVDNNHYIDVSASTTANWPATYVVNPSHAMVDHTDYKNTTFNTSAVGGDLYFIK